MSGSYTVVITEIASPACTDESDAVAVTVNSLPTAAISGTTTICNGQSTTLTANGGPSFSWTPGGATTAAITVNPSSSTTYTVVATDANGCTDAESATVTVNPLPTASISGTTTICNGQSTTLTANVGSTFVWTPGGTTTAAITVNPSSSTTYTVVATDANGCTDSESATVTVNPLPTASISGTTTICSGQSTTLTANGSSTFVWTPGGTMTAAITVNPSSSTTYTVVATDGNGCTDSESATVTVNPPCGGITAILSGSATICTGSTTNLSVAITGGASPYTVVYNNGTTDVTLNNYASGTLIPVSPTATKSYSLTSVTDFGGTPGNASGGATITVNPMTVGGVVAEASQDICSADVPDPLELLFETGSVVRWESSGNNATWVPISNTTTDYLPPALTTIHFFRAVVKSGVCPEVNSTTATIHVFNQAAVGGTVTPSQSICSGTAPSPLVLQNNAGSVEKWESSPDGSVWTEISNTTTTHSPGPLTATTHFRAVVSEGVCPLGDHSTAATITVIPLPTVSVSLPPAVCLNNGLVALNGTPSGGTWSGAGVSGSTFNPNTAGVGSHTITYTATSGVCTGSTSQSIVVLAPPTPTIAAATVCKGSTVIPTTTHGGGSLIGFSSSNNAIATVNFSGIVTGVAAGSAIITLGTEVGGCAGYATNTITVNALPTVTQANFIFPNVCLTTPAFALTGGSPAGGSYSGPGVFLGSNGWQFNAAAAGGAGLKTITYVNTNANGCTGAATNTIFVNGSCSNSCTITCPPAQNVNMLPATWPATPCKMIVPGFAPVVGNVCQSPVFSITQTPAALSQVVAAHNVPQNVFLSVTDLAGNVATCTVPLIPKDVSGPTLSPIACIQPANHVLPLNSSCKVSIPNYAPFIIPQSSDCLGKTATQVTKINGITQPTPSGLMSAAHNDAIQVIITVTDGTGNTTTCTRNSTAKDQTKPIISTCPAAESVPLGAGCVLTFPDKTSQLVATDACSNPLVKTQFPAAGSTIVTPPGPHTILFTVTDAAGNSQTCTTTITATQGSCPPPPPQFLGQDNHQTEAEKAPVPNSRETIENNPAIAEKPLELQTMPNPFSNELTIAFDLSESGKTKLVLLDLTGQFQFFKKENWLEKGRQKVIWNTEDLPDGAYFVGLKTETAGWIWRKVMHLR